MLARRSAAAAAAATPLDAGLAARLDSLQRAMRPTPVVQLSLDGLDLHAKLEMTNLAGSVKDRPALWILKSAFERGEIGPQTTVIESSSGNFAIALATFCRLLGLRFIPVVDPNISRVNEAALAALCPALARVDVPDDTGGYLKSRLAKVRELLASTPDSYWTNQYANADGMMAHYHLTAGEILDQVPRIDYLFVGVSTGGTLAGLSRRLGERHPRAKVIAVDAEGSVIFGAPPRKRYIPGIGSSIVPELVKLARIDDVVHVSELETVAGCRELLDRHHVFAGGSTGTVYAAIRKTLVPRRVGGRSPSVVFLAADRGLPYLGTVYDPAWVAWLRERHGP
jgi:cysteine synthase A